MGVVRSGERKLSFEVLASSTSFDIDNDNNPVYRSNSAPPIESKSSKSNRRKRRNKGSRKKAIDDVAISEQSASGDNGFQFNVNKYNVVYEEVSSVLEESVCTVSSVREAELRHRKGSFDCQEEESSHMRQIDDEIVKEEISCVTESSAKEPRVGSDGNGHHDLGKLEREESLDWNRLMDQVPKADTFSLEKSPVNYFLEEMYGGNSLRSTTTLADEKERERVYDTIFRLPWRCELLIDVGFFVCLDSFLSLLTIMPMRILMTFWRLLKTRQFKMLSGAELCDFGCFLVLACGVSLLQQTDISLIYHMIRGQGTIKLYVVYNVLEIFDKLCQNFGGDVLQTLFNSAEGFAKCSTENFRYWLWRFISDEALAVASSIIHSFVLLAQAITLSTCIVAHNNALLALLVSNNFAEIKSNVFKRFSKDNVQSLVYFDSIERFHISAFLIFVLAQNILEAEGPWFENFLFNALMVYVCELMIDIIKHSFIAKFNDLKPIVYSEYLEDLCKQTLNIPSGNVKKNLTFVPLAPACVVIRVLSPVYAAHLPCNPIVWRLFWIFLLSAMTFVMLTSLKALIGMSLRQHATWYIKRCERRKLHSD